MRINKMTSYAIRVVGRLHLEREGLLTSKQIAEKEQISQGMALKVLQELRQAEIVYSSQGRGGKSGGFGLNKDIKEVTIYDLMLAMEDEVNLYPDYDQDNYRGDAVYLFEELKRTHSRYLEELKKHTIHEILYENK